MQESHSEGLASHTDPESCAIGRKADREALTGARTGPGTELRKGKPAARRHSGAPTLLRRSGRPHGRRRERETSAGPARSTHLSMSGYILRGNREIRGAPVRRGRAGRIGKSKDARR